MGLGCTYAARVAVVVVSHRSSRGPLPAVDEVGVGNEAHRRPHLRRVNRAAPGAGGFKIAEESRFTADADEHAARDPAEVG